MTRTPLLIIAAAAALAGCNKENHTIVAGGPDAGEDLAVATNGPVTLPPSISASKIYRCADNSVVYVDWLSDGKSANVRTDKGAAPTIVTTAEPDQPMKADGGYELSGTAADPTAKIAVPGHSLQSCKA